ncbi:hypothetical protein H5410_002333 [Solanum commersonii]|uniref:Uncharacterized protein n=1 Tax=Solanum commersonii TaxID=4109 RepID=A0A9J6B1R6_SOLCO|nr:hypothetical protein H5410_002333 [Solanum commersonii]
MSNHSSSSKNPILLEVENSNSFQFSTPQVESLHSTPVWVIKPVGVPHDDPGVTSQPGVVSSMMSEQLLEGDLPKRKGYIQPPFSEAEYKTPNLATTRRKTVFDNTPKDSMGSDSFHEDEAEESETHLVWKRRGIRGANAIVDPPKKATNQTIESSETISEDVSMAVAKKGREAEKQSVKVPKVIRGSRKSPVKKGHQENEDRFHAQNG